MKEPDPYSLPDKAGSWQEALDLMEEEDRADGMSEGRGLESVIATPVVHDPRSSDLLCPNCSATLEERHCQLRCTRPCGYLQGCQE